LLPKLVWGTMAPKLLGPIDQYACASHFWGWPINGHIHPRQYRKTAYFQLNSVLVNVHEPDMNPHFVRNPQFLQQVAALVNVRLYVH